MQIDWYAPLRAIQSLGSKKRKIAHQGELAQARKEHLAQFFTPDAVARFMWRFVENTTATTLFDNSIGSARLMQFANPTQHQIYGVDVHADTVMRVMSTAESAGFTCKVIHAGMQDISAKHFDVGLINPPFSIHLESTNLHPYPGCTTMGKLGANTSAMSEMYSLHQALDACAVVIALMPKNRAIELFQSTLPRIRKRLRAVYHLPSNCFKEEGTSVETAVLVFGTLEEESQAVMKKVEDLDIPLPDWGLQKAIDANRYDAPRLTHLRRKAILPAINLPVTGNKDVHIHLDGRRIKLKFACGLTQAKVLNAILVKRIFSTELHRLPKNVHFSGQGRLDLMSYMMDKAPVEAFKEFMALINQAGGNAVPHSSVIPSIIKRARRTQRALVPFRRTVWSKGNLNQSQFEAVAKESHNIDPTAWVSPVIQKGEKVQFTATKDGKYSFMKNGKPYLIGTDRFEAMYNAFGHQEGWHTVHDGKQCFNQEHANLLRHRAKALGIDQWLNWKFQLDDLIEILMQPRSAGCIGGWEQACGKSRLAAALILLSGVKHGLIVVESRLVMEMKSVLSVLPIDVDAIHVIESPDDLKQLKTINIISYERLRLPLRMPVIDQPGKTIASKHTYAKALRRRIGLVIPDEAEKLGNIDSEQSRALFQLSAKRRVALTGTPISNYPRSVHGLMLFVGGDATPYQPYGFHRGYLSQVWLRSMEYVPRGVAKVAEDFVVLEWATNEFMENLGKGAKREVPKIRNLDAFREWLSPVMKRRIVDEPEVQPFINLPPIIEEVITLDWDPVHLAHYLTVADEFANWYKSENDNRRNNLALLLAKIQAVHMALNVPQSNPNYRGGLTSKQAYELNRLCEIAKEGKKSLLFCNNPMVVDIFHRELKKRNIKSVRFTGKQSIANRNKEKDEEFKFGDAPHLLATLGCAKSGQNLPQADYVLFYDRCWSFRTQDQAIKRPRRTERKEPIKAEFLHLPGGLDVYQAQLIAFKKDATRSGVDWASPELDEVEFVHLTTVLERFVQDLAKLHQISHYAMREQLKTAA